LYGKLITGMTLVEDDDLRQNYSILLDPTTRVPYNENCRVFGEEIDACKHVCMRKYCTSSDATADRFVQKDNPVSLKEIKIYH
jgi:hypothetical protein